MWVLRKSIRVWLVMGVVLTPLALHAQLGVDIEKFTNGVDADTPPGPTLLVGDPVTWTYVVTNNTNETLVNIAVTDDQGVTVTCPAPPSTPATP